MTQQGQAIIQAVRDVAAGNPLHVYGTGNCVYVRQGLPACLIGRALWNLGLIDGSLEGLMVNGARAGELVEGRLGIALSQDESFWLERAQEAQDSGYAWMDAVRIADEYVADHIAEHDLEDEE